MRGALSIPGLQVAGFYRFTQHVMEFRQEIVLEAGRTERNYWRDLLTYRELFATLAWRDISVRYKQTIIGVSWALIQPLASAIAFWMVFGKLAGMEAQGSMPYILTSFCGTMAWQFFATSLTGSSNSLVSNANLLTKIYFPRLIVPTSAVIVAFVDFAIAFSILVALMLFLGVLPGFTMLLVPVFVVLICLLALGLGLWFAALNVRFRDVRIIVPFIIQFGQLISPVGYATSNVPAEFRLLYSMNPLVGIIDGVRWAVLGQEMVYPPALVLSLLITGLLLASGIWYFRRTERTFADII